MEFGVKQTIFDTDNGTRVNIKEGTDEILAASVTAAMDDTGTTPAWAPSHSAPALFEGYTSVAGDGGLGGLDGNATFGPWTSAAQDHVHLINLHVHNTGSDRLVFLGDWCTLYRCKLNNSTASRGIELGAKVRVLGCYVYDVGGRGIEIGSGVVSLCFLENGTKDFTQVLYHNAANQAVFYHNAIKIGGASDGIALNYSGVAENNSIWSNGGTGKGMRAVGSNQSIHSVLNNLVEGFSDSGGVGFDFSASGTNIKIYGGNGSYDSATHYSAPSDYTMHELGGAASNEILSASPFVNAAGGDFRPVNTGNVKEGSLPALIGGGLV